VAATEILAFGWASSGVGYAWLKVNPQERYGNLVTHLRINSLVPSS